jgi:hypothetical protein
MHSTNIIHFEVGHSALRLVLGEIEVDDQFVLIRISKETSSIIGVISDVLESTLVATEDVISISE